MTKVEEAEMDGHIRTLGRRRRVESRRTTQGRRRMEVLMFTGDDAHAWIVQVERYFKLNAVREDEKLGAVVVALEDRALNWYQ